MTIGAGTYGASVLGHLGIDVLFADSEDAYPTVEEHQLVETEIDVVLAPSEPYPFGERHLDLLNSIAPVMLVDGQDLFGGDREPLPPLIDWTNVYNPQLMGVDDGATNIWNSSER